jgi:hypothetical protein
VAVITTPWVIQALSHPSDVFRRMLKAIARGSGVVLSGDLAVAQHSTPNMSVDVAAGSCIINGTENAVTQGAYHVTNDALLVLSIAASDPTNPRNDLVVAKIQDATYSGGTNAPSIVVITGTPAGSPVDPAVPANAITLARVVVAANVSSIVTANITDLRPGLALTLSAVSTAVQAVLGLFSPAANVLAFATTSLERMRITAAGLVGIGTLSPSTPLHVNGPNTAAYSAAGSNAVANNVLEVQNTGADTAGMWAGIAFTLPTGANRIGGIGLVSRGVANQKADLFFFGDDGNNRAEKLRLTAEGHLITTAVTAPTASNVQGGTIITAVSILGTDTACDVTLTAGTTPPAAASPLSVVTFNTAYSVKPVVQETCESIGGAASYFYSTNVAVGSFDIRNGVLFGASATYHAHCTIIGR